MTLLRLISSFLHESAAGWRPELPEAQTKPEELQNTNESSQIVI